MRFKLDIVVPINSIIPINYQYELSSWIYHVINCDKEFADWLHNKGFTDEKEISNYLRFQI